VSVAFEHTPVLLRESIDHLDPRPGDVVVDGTLGAGGHAAAILERIAPDGILIGLDVDPEALAAASERLRAYGERVRIVRASFRRIGDVLAGERVARVDGVLLDLGVSSPQLDDPRRGFRFASATAAATALDMRMDPDASRSAAELLERASEADLERWFREYGELPGAHRLARAIVREREARPLETVADLLRVISAARVGRGRRHHPATLAFQALRIAVNDELGALAQGLAGAVAALRPGGRLVVIAYHSLEDRLVKRFFRDGERGCTCPPRQPACTCGGRVTLRLTTRRAVRPAAAELAANPRSRSARLRAAVRAEAA
jgi:16S rRNA (cytosine1402-N4)-methyltransferase